jgi:hypothetical protein
VPFVPVGKVDVPMVKVVGAGAAMTIESLTD